MQNISWRVKLDKGAVLIFGTMLVVSGCSSGSSLEQSKTMEMTTWSVVAVDPLSGDVGVASASCVPSFADALAALVPGKGAAATQASFDIDNRNVVYEAIKELSLIHI